MSTFSKQIKTASSKYPTFPTNASALTHHKHLLNFGALTHHKHLLNFGNAFPKNGAQLVPYTSQQEAKERDSQKGVDDAEDPSPFRVRGDIPKTFKKKTGSG